MPAALRKLFTSAKFWSALGGIVALVALHYGIEVDPDLLDKIFYIIIALIGGQSIADIGKPAAEVAAGKTLEKVKSDEAAMP